MKYTCTFVQHSTTVYILEMTATMASWGMQNGGENLGWGVTRGKVAVVKGDFGWLWRTKGGAHAHSVRYRWYTSIGHSTVARYKVPWGHRPFPQGYFAVLDCR